MSDLVLWQEGDIVSEYLEVGENFVRPTVNVEDIPDDVIGLAWQRAGKIEGLLQWYVGGLYNITKGKYGGRAKRAKEIAEAHGFAPRSVQIYGEVDENVEIDSRLSILSFSHHQEVKSLSPHDQTYWLAEAEKNEWSKSKLRNEIRAWQNEKALEDSPEPAIIDDAIVNANALEIDWPQGIDLLVTDPPYGMTVGDTSGARDGKGDWDEFTYEELDMFNRAWIGKARQSLAANGSLIVTGSVHNIFNIGHILKEQGFYIIRDIVWNKPFVQRAMNTNALVPSHELIIWARLGDSHTINLYEVTRDVWDVQPERILDHPTEKPEKLAEQLIGMASNIGDLVADPFTGSGTFPAVAQRLKRRYWACEQDQRWWNVAQQRIGDGGV